MKYMYIRVSTEQQSTARQEVNIQSEQVDKAFIDKCSGKNFDRPQYQEMKSILKSGDILVLHSIDRLGRNYDMIIDEWRSLSEMGVGVKVLDMPLLDTTDKNKSLDTKFLSDLVLQILSYVAERERLNTKERVKQGIAEAKKRGVYEVSVQKRAKTMGYIQDWKKFGVLYNRYVNMEISNKKFAELLGIAVTTLNRRILKYEKENSLEHFDLSKEIKSRKTE